MTRKPMDRTPSPICPGAAPETEPVSHVNGQQVRKGVATTTAVPQAAALRSAIRTVGNTDGTSRAAKEERRRERQLIKDMRATIAVLDGRG